jgi:hypothetical protein
VTRFLFSSNYHLPIHFHLRRGEGVAVSTKGNPRLELASDSDLGKIEISPFGLH